jgi:hypothetical protein
MKRTRVYSNIYNSTEVGFNDSNLDDLNGMSESFNYMAIGYMPHELSKWSFSIDELLFVEDLRQKKRKLGNYSRLDNEWEFSVEFKEEEEGKNFVLFCMAMKNT